MRSLLLRLKNSPYKKELIMVMAVSFVTMLFFCYKDGLSLTIWSTNLLDCLAQGRLKDFYFYNLENLHNSPIAAPAGISIPSRIPLALWCIPIWIAQYFFGVEIRDSVFSMIWARLFYYVILLIILIFVEKICHFLQYEETQISIILFLCMSSVFVHIQIDYTGQSDLQWILFGVVAFYYYIKDDWIKFILYSNISVFLKPYFFPLAILLILYKEKDVLLVALKSATCCVFYFVIPLFFRNYPGLKESRAANSTFMTMLAGYVNFSWLSPYGWVSILVFVCVLMAGFCYFVNYRKREISPEMAVYIAASFYLLWFLVAGENFYRMVMLVPWLYMAAFRDKNKNELMLWLTTLFSYALIMVYRFHETEHYFNIRTGMLTSVIPTEVIMGKKDFFANLRVSMGSTFEHMGFIVNGIWVGVSLILILIMCPLLEKRYLFEAHSKNRECVKRFLLVLNVLAILLLDSTALISFLVR